MTIATEFQGLFNSLIKAAVDKALDEALDQSLPLAGTALNAVTATLFGELQTLIGGLPALPDDKVQIANALDGLQGVTAVPDGINNIVTIGIDFTQDAEPLGGLNAALDFAGLEGDLNITPSLGGRLKLDLSYDVENSVLSVTNGDNALTLDLGIAIGANANLDLGLVEVSVEDGNTTTPEIALGLVVDIPAGAVSTITPNAITVDVTGGVDVNFKLRGDVPILPDIVAEFIVDWDFVNGAPTTAPALVQFKDIGIDIASMLDILADVMDPILGFTKEFPLNDIITGLTEPVPEPFNTVLKFIDVDRIPLEDGDGKVNLLDFVAIYFEQQGNDAAVEALSLFAEALGIIQLLTGGANDSLAGGEKIVKLLDKIDITDGDVSDPGDLLASADPVGAADFLMDLANQFEEAIQKIEGLIESVQTSLAGGVSDTVGLAFPILDNPESIISLLLPDLFPGAPPVTFVEYDLPALKAEVTVGDFFFPILGPIGINLGGAFAAGIDFKIAYDSLGLTDPGPDGFTPDDLLKGLVLRPSKPGDPVAYIDSEIFAEAGVNLVAIKAFIGGGLTGNVDAFFPDGPGGDELRFDDVAAGCIFDPISGKIAADLRARLVIGFGPFSWTARKTLAETTLVDFSFGCDGDGTLATDPGKGLAAIKAGDSSTLILHAGGLANRRSINTTAGVDQAAPGGETYRIGNTVDANGNLIAGALTVSAFGINETYGSPGAPILKIGGPNGFGSIHGANFGQGDDTLLIAASVQQEADVFMGVGNDYAAGGAGKDILRGDAGFDQLVGNGGNDQLFGGLDDDTLEGGLGGDLLDGGAGIDQVTYENSSVAVIFNKLPDASGAFLGEGGEAEGDRLVSIEYIVGSNFHDILRGNPNVGNTLEGRSGNDALFGGNAADFLLGGIGGDHMDGGAGRDGTSYLSSYGAVTIDLLFNVATGGDADGDQLISIEDVQGTMFDDVLLGTHSANRFEGWYGHDILEGRGGADILIGDDGNDIIYAGVDGDLLSGGNGIDLLSYIGSAFGVTVNLRNGFAFITALGSGGDLIGAFDESNPNLFHQNTSEISNFENLDGSNFSDNLTGDGGSNVIRGWNGDDIIDGGHGDDTLIGGEGADQMTGGDHFSGQFGGDWADYSASPAGVTADLVSGGIGGDAEGDSYDEIENLRGSDHNDTLTGDDNDNVFDTRLGVDEVQGGAGIDTLYVDYSRGDDGEGMTGGFLGEGSGSFERLDAPGGAVLDSILFSSISRLFVIGTYKADVITGGSGDDDIYSGGGADDVIGGGGADFLYTEDGDDEVHGGDGKDVIRPGLGADTVNGGRDYNFGAGGEASLDDPPPNDPDFEDLDITEIMVIENESAFAQNGGDLLEVDYSSVTAGGVLSTVEMVQSAHPPIAIDIKINELSVNTVPRFFNTNQGNYHIDALGSTDSVDFTEIERVHVTGTNQDDVLVGTYDVLAGVSFGDALAVSARGDDVLEGLDGDDVLIGNTGDDDLFGDNGNDVLVGETNVLSPDEEEDYLDTVAEYHVDDLTGGLGADLFVLGLGDTVFYTGPAPAEENHAIIWDFSAEEGDVIQLSGDHEDYFFDESGTSTFIYLGNDANDDLIAEVKNTSDLSPTGDRVHYVTVSDTTFPTPLPSPFGLLSASAASGPTAFSSTIGSPIALAVDWITQTNDGDLLRDTLLGAGATGLNSLGVTLNGDGRAFGTVAADNPFGLGAGIILSTGKVEDLEGANTIDGGLFRGLSGKDLSTDFAVGGSDGDTIQFVYTFEKTANASVDTLVFDFIMFSEEFREYGGSQFNDSFRILLNGVNLATLTDGTAAVINNLMPSPYVTHPDLILNPVGTGPLADQIKADAYTKTLSFAGHMLDGINTLTIEVKDIGDGRWDSGILVKGGTFKAVASTGTLKIGGAGSGSSGLAKIVEGDDCFKVPVTIDPGLRGNLIAPLVITVTPSADVDLGNGPGKPKVFTINPGDPLTFELCVTAPNDKKGEGNEFGTLNFSTKSNDPAYDGLPIAPMVLEIVDALPKVTLVTDQALEGSSGPLAFGDGVTIQGYDRSGKAAELGYGDGGIGVIGSKAGKKVESTFHDEVDYRGGKSERLVINFDNPVSDIALTLGQFYRNEAKRGERATFSAFDADGELIATGMLAAGKDSTKVSEAVWRFDLGLNGVSRIEIGAADIYAGGKQGKLQSDFNLQSVSYAPTTATTDPKESAIAGTNGKDVVDAISAVEGQPGPSAGVDVIAGLGGKDRLSGLGGNDTVDGGAGNDRLRGDDGDDLIIGGAGRDNMAGGDGADRFLFNAALSSRKADKIIDFTPGEDLILLDDRVFTKLAPGPLDAKAFFRGEEAKDGNDRVGYDPDTGIVLYDKNGSKDGRAVAVATLKAGLDIGKEEFLVV